MAEFEEKSDAVEEALRKHRLIHSDLAGWYGRCICGANFEFEKQWLAHRREVISAALASEPQLEERDEQERLADFHAKVRAALEENLEPGEDTAAFRDALLVLAAEL